MVFLITCLSLIGCGDDSGDGSDDSDDVLTLDAGMDAEVDGSNPVTDAGPDGQMGYSTIGCEQFFVDLCDALQACPQSAAQTLGDSCEMYVTQNPNAIRNGCTTTLQSAVSMDLNGGCWLAGASASDVSSCFDIGCNMDTRDAVTAFLDMQNAANAVALFALGLSSCPIAGACASP